MTRPVRLLVAFGLALLPFAPAAHGQGEAPAATSIYDVAFEARIRPSERVARATIRLGAGADAVVWIQLRIDPERHVDFHGDGSIDEREGLVRWTPPRSGGALHYTFRIDQLRNASSYDARCAEHWAMFRGGDLFPPARVRTQEGAHSRSTLRFRVPKGWSVATPYRSTGPRTFEVIDERRRFDRPIGWMQAGRLGILRERIAGTRVAVSGPVGQGVRRQDMLAFLRWTLPPLRDALGSLPERLLVVSGTDPLWRGGLSAPRSVYIHADRPLITGDGTSPLLHELVHTSMRARSGVGGDWIVEGLAEYYSIEVLRRSRTISRRRYERVFERQRRKGRGSVVLAKDPADTVAAARAVGVFRALDASIQTATEGAKTLDDVVAILAARREPITTAALREAVAMVAGRDLVPRISGEPRS